MQVIYSICIWEYFKNFYFVFPDYKKNSTKIKDDSLSKSVSDSDDSLNSTDNDDSNKSSYFENPNSKRKKESFRLYNTKNDLKTPEVLKDSPLLKKLKKKQVFPSRLPRRPCSYKENLSKYCNDKLDIPSRNKDNSSEESNLEEKCEKDILGNPKPSEKIQKENDSCNKKEISTIQPDDGDVTESLNSSAINITSEENQESDDDLLFAPDNSDKSVSEEVSLFFSQSEFENNNSTNKDKDKLPELLDLKSSEVDDKKENTNIEPDLLESEITTISTCVKAVEFSKDEKNLSPSNKVTELDENLKTNPLYNDQETKSNVTSQKLTLKRKSLSCTPINISEKNNDSSSNLESDKIVDPMEKHSENEQVNETHLNDSKNIDDMSKNCLEVKRISSHCKENLKDNFHDTTPNPRRSKKLCTVGSSEKICMATVESSNVDVSTELVQLDIPPFNSEETSFIETYFLEPNETAQKSKVGKRSSIDLREQSQSPKKDSDEDENMPDDSSPRRSKRIKPSSSSTDLQQSDRRSLRKSSSRFSAQKRSCRNK